jgi:hypothetical protein
MKLEAHIDVEIKDKDGIIISRVNKIANSLVIYFIDKMYQFNAFTSGSIKDTGNTVRTVYGYQASGNNYALISAVAGSGDATIGIVVGTGTTAVTMTDYVLQTKINHGSGSGQLSYNAQSFTAPSTVGSTRSYTIQRTWNNLSGADITINEVGIYISDKSSGVDYRFLLDRTLSTFTIPNSGGGTVTYTISITV